MWQAIEIGWTKSKEAGRLGWCQDHQKSASDRTGLGYGFSSSNTASTSSTVFVPPSNNVEIENNNVKTILASENLDKGKSILGAPSNQDKKETKNPGAKKANSQKPKQKK